MPSICAVGPVFLHFGDDVLVGGAHCGRVHQVELDAAGIGLVRDVGRVDFHRHREAELLGQEQRLAGRAGDDGARHRDAECGQQGLGFHLREHLAPFGQHGFDQHARALHVRLVAVRERAGSLRQQALVAVEGGDVGEGFHRGFRRAEGGDAGLGKCGPSGLDLDVAHPAGQQRLVEAAGDLDQRVGHLQRVGHRLGGEDDQRAVHAGIFHAQGDRVAVAFRRGVADDVHRVVVRPGGGKHFIQLRDGLVGQAGNGYAQVDRMVDRHHARPAAVGDDRQPVAAGAVGRGKGLGGGKQLADRHHAHHAGAAHRGVEHVVGADQRAGVRHHRLRAGGMAPDLDHEHRLGAGGGAQGAHEAARLVDALDVDQDALGLRV